MSEYQKNVEGLIKNWHVPVSKPTHLINQLATLITDSSGCHDENTIKYVCSLLKEELK